MRYAIIALSKLCDLSSEFAFCYRKCLVQSNSVVYTSVKMFAYL